MHTFRRIAVSSRQLPLVLNHSQEKRTEGAPGLDSKALCEV